MRELLRKHHIKIRHHIIRRLKEFKNVKEENIKEEMAFCIFAANSSAKMGLLAVSLLKPVISTNDLEKYKEAVHKKVRFYNKRAEYFHHNVLILNELKGLLKKLNSLNFDDRREFIRDNFKGFGMKESSHFLRNIGYSGYCIIDKHVLNMMKDLNVIKSNKPPKNDKEYMKIEKRIKEFAKKNNYDVDELDLALWSFKTGEIIK